MLQRCDDDPTRRRLVTERGRASVFANENARASGDGSSGNRTNLALYERYKDGSRLNSLAYD